MSIRNIHQTHCLVQDVDSRSKCITAHGDNGTADDVVLTDLEIESGRWRMRNAALLHQLMAEPKQEFESLHQLSFATDLLQANNLDKKGSEDPQAADVRNRTAWS
uniref:WGS project CBMI000000000 data, contig CS3069_c002044 n=1 Tax=Fusarium clavum TaxID=2594811 RepID=A0A090MCA6_9HYPO|nr:unnamed protein product [Fusarium clavum]